MNKKWSSVFWGVFLIICAGALIASQLGVWGEFEISTRKAAITVILAVIAVKSLFDRNFAGMLFPVAILCIMFDDVLGITALTPWTVLLVALLLSIALTMIFRDWCRKGRCWHHVDGGADWDKAREHFDTVIDEEDGEVIYSDVSFSGTVKYVNTDNFKKAYIKNSFGATKMYFDKAVIQGDQAEIQIQNSFGGVDLYIPGNWRIVNRVEVSFGDVEEKNVIRGVAADKEVYLTGSVSFGGVTIRYI